ncbi:MAG TPA: hypothetical protein PKA19_14870 [Bacillota bacterium]|nr:hypothetical protein [Bacillota bacterium]
MSKKTDAWDYLDMAYEADSEETALKYARKALKLDPNCLDAEMMVSEITIRDQEELKIKYEELIAKEEAHLREGGLLTDENIGSFWGIVETRPYMRLRFSYLHLLIDMGKFRMAAKACEELLELSEGDNMGVRYILMSLYAFFEDELSVNRLYKRFEREESTQMLLPLIALYYKMDNYDKAEQYLKKLYEVNEELEEVFCSDEEFDEETLDDVIDSGMYQIGSKEEIMVAMTDAAFLYTTTVGLFRWIASRIENY